MFDNIVGNEKIKELLTTTVKNNKTSHSYLFSGPEGIGKKLMAEEFSKMILGQIENNPDFSCIEPDDKGIIKIEKIREMQTKVQEKPIASKQKIYIIDNADKMTTEAQNCLLKTLEEPPSFVIIILIGSNENAFLSTIKSRCMIISFEPIKDEEISKYLKKNYDIDATPTMLEMFQGSIAKAIELKDQNEIYEKTNELINSIENSDFIEFTTQSEYLYQTKDDIQKLLEYINTILLRLAKSNHKYASCISIVEDTKKRIKQNCNYEMTIDNMIWNMWREIN